MNIITDSETKVLDEEKLVIANQLLSAFRQNDWDLLSSIITDDVTWSRPGENLLSGIVNGKNVFIERGKALFGCGLSFRFDNIQLSYYGFALSIHIGYGINYPS